MLTRFIEYHLRQARYKILDDGQFYGAIPGLKGVWATAKSLSACQTELKSVLEGWLVLKIRDGDRIPGLVVNRRAYSPRLQYA